MLIQQQYSARHNNSSYSTKENYYALLAAILNTTNNNIQVNFSHLFDKEEEVRRVKEIEEIRSKGGKTELEIWYKNAKKFEVIKQSDKNRRKAAIENQDKLRRARLARLKPFEDEIIDCRDMSFEEIRKHKVKIIDLETGDIKIYADREILAKEFKIKRCNISMYIKKGYISRKKYYFTISDELVNQKSIKENKEKNKYKLTNIETNEIYKFTNLHKISEFLEINYNTFYARYSKSKTVLGYKIQKMSK
ncbi:hypothetical protein [Terrisporobacter sp.]|uniref:hypothetical protein n=1 Tax=Terrisporobacter sp. TaxID=1965305 RepID=UPI002609D25D|nr:hypothetical protein [Terrisporobacter sp.]